MAEVNSSVQKGAGLTFEFIDGLYLRSYRSLFPSCFFALLGINTVKLLLNIHFWRFFDPVLFLDISKSHENRSCCNQENHCSAA